MRNSKKPAWWELYALVVVAGGALVGEATLPLNSVARKIVLMGIVVVFYGLIGTWLKGNQSYYIDDEAQDKPVSAAKSQQGVAPLNRTAVQQHYLATIAQAKQQPMTHTIDTHRKVN